jgi:glycosyltransferase involved in cell wall biosynthesis
MLTGAKQPLLSVVCPVTAMAGRLSNLKMWLTEVLRENVEVFLIHDISDQATHLELVALVTELNSSKLKFSQGKYQSAAAARNSVLNMCRGTWLAFWDSDDVPMFSEVLAELDLGFDLMIGDFEVSRPDRRRELVRKSDNYAKALSEVSFNPGIWRMVFKRDMFEALRFPEIKMGEDQDYLAQIQWKKIKVKLVTKVFYRYYDGQEFQTTAKGKSRKSLLKSLEILQYFLREEKGDERFIRNLIARQALTLLKSEPLLIKARTLVLLAQISKTPFKFIEQFKSFIYLVNYLRKQKLR